MAELSAETHEQAMACLTCGLGGMTPDEAFPQEDGFWDRPCPRCGEMTVWVTEPQPKGEGSKTLLEAAKYMQREVWSLSLTPIRESIAPDDTSTLEALDAVEKAYIVLSAAIDGASTEQSVRKAERR